MMFDIQEVSQNIKEIQWEAKIWYLKLAIINCWPSTNKGEETYVDLPPQTELNPCVKQTVFQIYSENYTGGAKVDLLLWIQKTRVYFCIIN